jgi:rhodanese-related sulfurtransferase
VTAGDAVSPQWRAWRASVDLHEYEARFAHEAAHGEADLIERLARDLAPVASVLDAGCGTGRVAIELDRRGLDVVGVDLDDDMLELARAKALSMRWLQVDLARMQLDRRFGVVAMPGNVMRFCRDIDRRGVVHSCVQHLEPGGVLVAGFGLASSHGGHAIDLAEYDGLCGDCDLTLVDRLATWEGAPYEGGDYAVSIHRRGTHFNVHDLVHAARGTIQRVTVTELQSRLDSDTPPTVVDTRTAVDRARFGTIPGSIHVPRTVLEWRFDPSSGYRHPSVVDFDQPLVLVCNHGYSSSLAAASLVRLGFTSVADLVGGMQAWIAADIEVDHPDHSHLDL